MFGRASMKISPNFAPKCRHEKAMNLQPMTPINMKLSIIIPTLNRYADLRNTIRDLLAQSEQDFEILIIDQTDASKRENMGGLSAKISHIYFDIKSASAARNIGIRQAKGEVLLFLDDDVIIENKDFLHNHLRHYDQADIPGVVGLPLDKGQKIRHDKHKWSENPENGWLFFPLTYAYPAKIASGRSNNLSVRKSCAVAVGGMDENYEKGAHREEADFCVRVSRRFGLFQYDPEAMLVHIGNPQGGIRSWNDNKLLKAQHHFDGAWYFVFKMVRWQDLPVHLFATLLFFFYRKPILKSPKLLLITLSRFFKGIWNGYKLSRRPPIYLTMLIGIFAALLLPMSGCQQESVIEAGKYAFGIQGELEDCLADSVKLYETDGYAIRQIHAIPLVKSGSNATFTFKGRVPQRGFYLLGTSTNNYCELILGGEEEMKLSGNGTNWAKLTQLDNSPQNINYQKLMREIQRLNLKTDSLHQEQAALYQNSKMGKYQKATFALRMAAHRSTLNAFRDSVAKADPYQSEIAEMSIYPLFDIANNPKKYPNIAHFFANEYFKNVDFKQANLGYQTPLWHNVITYSRTLVQASSSLMGGDTAYQFLDRLLQRPPAQSRTYRLVLTGIMKALEAEASPVFSKYVELYSKTFPDEAATMKQYKDKMAEMEAEENRKKQFELGATPPDFTLTDADNKQIGLSSYRGKVLLLEFWSSTVPLSRRHHPNMLAVYKKLHFKGFDILSVGIEKNKNNWSDAYAADKLPWTQVSDLSMWESPVVQTYMVKTLPTNYLLDAEGKIIGKNVFGAELERLVKQALKIDE